MKTNAVQWPDDPVVEEVRRARRELWKRAGGTIAGLIRLVGETETSERTLANKKRRAKPRSGSGG